jgi:hypothetical protein
LYMNDFPMLFLDCRPVVDRRLHTFLASPRKVCQRRRPRFAALRVPACASQKMGSVRNSPSAQTADTSLSIFCLAQPAAQKRNSESTATARLRRLGIGAYDAPYASLESVRMTHSILAKFSLSEDHKPTLGMVRIISTQSIKICSLFY